MDTMNIHATIDRSRANGPGRRAVIWVQGCPFDCPGCFNPEIRVFKGGWRIRVSSLFQWLVSLGGISGLTLSGGEPTEQISALLPLLLRVRSVTSLSVLLFSGRTIEEILHLRGGKEFISLLDVLIDGRYDVTRANPPGVWPSSANQQIHLLTPRYTMADFTNLPCSEAIITAEGETLVSGLRPPLPACGILTTPDGCCNIITTL